MSEFENLAPVYLTGLIVVAALDMLRRVMGIALPNVGNFFARLLLAAIVPLAFGLAAEHAARRTLVAEATGQAAWAPVALKSVAGEALAPKAAEGEAHPAAAPADPSVEQIVEAYVPAEFSGIAALPPVPLLPPETGTHKPYVLVSDALPWAFSNSKPKKPTEFGKEKSFALDSGEAQTEYDFESIDVIQIGDKDIWLVVSEGLGIVYGRVIHRKVDLNIEPPKPYTIEVINLKDVMGGNKCNRGIEGIAAKDNGDAVLIAVLWEGGTPRNKEEDGLECAAEAKSKDHYQRARIAVFNWKPDPGNAAETTNVALYEVEIPHFLQIDPEDNKEKTHYFRAPDLRWHGNALLLLLSSTGKGQGGQKEGAYYNNVRLQAFCPSDDLGTSEWATGEKVKARLAKPKKGHETILRSGDKTEQPSWQEEFKKPNWEGFDWTGDESKLVLVADNDRPTSAVVSFKYSKPEPTCDRSWLLP